MQYSFCDAALLLTIISGSVAEVEAYFQASIYFNHLQVSLSWTVSPVAWEISTSSIPTQLLSASRSALPGLSRACCKHHDKLAAVSLRVVSVPSRRAVDAATLCVLLAVALA